MSLLESIHKGKRQSPPRILIYGIEGIGKSTLGAQAPKPIFIPTEDGLDRISCESFPLCQSYDDIITCLKTLVNEDHPYNTVVIDSLDWAEKLIWSHVCKQFGVKSIEKADGGYARGYDHAVTYWHQIVDQLRILHDVKKMVIMLLAHAKIEKHNDPESQEFDRFSPKLHKKANSFICEWVDAILLATREFGAAKGDKGGGQRILRCTPSAVGVAKNRYGFPDVLPLSWDALYQAIIGGTNEKP
jgi:hypothetical protein